MKRVVIRLNDEEFETLKMFKGLTNLSWKDLILGGFTFWYEKLNIEEKLKKIREIMHDEKVK
ncbi:MAG: hypothetical protein QXE05_04620 [Nitrososphaeria archaeon]